MHIQPKEFLVAVQLFGKFSNHILWHDFNYITSFVGVGWHLWWCFHNINILLQLSQRIHRNKTRFAHIFLWWITCCDLKSLLRIFQFGKRVKQCGVMKTLRYTNGFKNANSFAFNDKRYTQMYACFIKFTYTHQIIFSKIYLYALWYPSFKCAGWNFTMKESLRKRTFLQFSASPYLGHHGKNMRCYTWTIR